VNKLTRRKIVWMALFPVFMPFVIAYLWLSLTRIVCEFSTIGECNGFSEVMAVLGGILSFTASAAGVVVYLSTQEF
jgi:hypothetical protein